MSTESIRKTVTIPPELWAKVRIEKIQEGDEFLSDVVIRALEEHFIKTDEETRLLRIQIVDAEVKYALANPLERDELRALYKAYYRTWSKEDIVRRLVKMGLLK